MKLFVTVKTNSKKLGVDPVRGCPKDCYFHKSLKHLMNKETSNGVKQIDSTHFVVRVKESPIEGRANEAVIKAMSLILNIPPSSLELVSGTKSKNKILSTGNK